MKRVRSLKYLLLLVAIATTTAMAGKEIIGVRVKLNV